MKKIPKECEETLAKVNDLSLERARRRLSVYETGGGVGVLLELMSKRKRNQGPWKTIHIANGLTPEQANGALIALRSYITQERQMQMRTRDRTQQTNEQNQESKQ